MTAAARAKKAPATVSGAKKGTENPSLAVGAPMESRIPNIAKFANSQNKVSEADFFSNHDFHRRLETFSRRIWAPAKAGTQHETHWFYERARGQYLNDQAALSPAKRRQFLEANPRDQLITKTDLAKSEVAWRGLPHVVSLGAQKNFLSLLKRSQRPGWPTTSARKSVTS